MRIGQTSFIYFTSRFVGSILGFIATIYFARTLGEEVLGYYALVTALVMWLSIIGDVGISKAITKRISEGNDREKYATAGFLLILLLLVVVIIALFITQSYVNEYVGVEVAGLVMLLVFTTLFRTSTNAALKGYHLVHIYAILSGVKQLGRYTIQIGLVLIGFELIGMILGYAAGGLLVGLIGLWYLDYTPEIPTKSHFVDIIKFAQYSWLGNIRSRSFNYVDVAILGFFVAPSLVGIYSVAWSLAMFLDMFGDAIRTTVFPELSGLSDTDDLNEISNILEETLTYAGLFLIPGLVGTIVIGDLLLQLFGDGFTRGTTILVVLTGSCLIYSYSMQLINLLNGIDRPDLAFKVNVYFIGSNIVLNSVLVYQFGWIGAAVATLASASIGLVVSYKYVNSIINFKLPIFEIAKQILASILMMLLLISARIVNTSLELIEQNELLVITLVGFAATIYVSLLISISGNFRSTVINNLPSKVRFRL